MYIFSNGIAGYGAYIAKLPGLQFEAPDGVLYPGIMVEKKK